MKASRHACLSTLFVMGPRVGRTTPYQRSQVPTTNGDVPPSSLAAQIAGRLANGHQYSKAQERDSFCLLLGEILDGNEHVWETDAATSSDAAANSRLICVIVQAGLGLKSNRLAGILSPEEKGYIIRSLQAVDLILSRSSKALFQPLDLDFAPGFPLFAWLIPKILVETRESDFNDIEQLVRDIINRSLTIAEQAKTRLKRVPQVAKYVQGLITGTYPVFTGLFDRQN